MTTPSTTTTISPAEMRSLRFPSLFTMNLAAVSWKASRP